MKHPIVEAAKEIQSEYPFITLGDACNLVLAERQEKLLTMISASLESIAVAKTNELFKGQQVPDVSQGARDPIPSSTLHASKGKQR